MLYLGLDASTQSLTAIVIEIGATSRRIVFQYSLNFDRDLPEYGTTAGVKRGEAPGEVFASPLMWADALDRMLGVLAASAEVEVERIRAISGAAQQHGSVYLNAAAGATLASLTPVSPLARQLPSILSRQEAPVWLDASTSEECREIDAALGGADETRRLTGSPATERFTGPQIRRFHRLQPERYAATTRIHLVSSFMASLLAGGDAPVDPGDASGTNLMDITTSRWAPHALDATAPDLGARLPRIQPSCDIVGTLSTYWQRRYSLPPAAVVTWTGDNPSSLIGTGIVRPGLLAVSLGTSDTVFATADAPAGGASHVFRSPTGKVMNLVCFRNGSLAREWVRARHGLDWDGVARLLDERPGNDGCVMLPWHEAEITPPVIYAGVRRFGFDGHDAGQDVRGLVEGQMMALANHAAAVTSGAIDRVVATGGAAENRALLQVMANVFGVEVDRLDVTNAAALGAALRAYHADRLAAGEPISWRTVVSGLTDPAPFHRVTPDPKLAAMYADLRRDYATLERLHRERRPIC